MIDEVVHRASMDSAHKTIHRRFSRRRLLRCRAPVLAWSVVSLLAGAGPDGAVGGDINPHSRGNCTWARLLEPLLSAPAAAFTRQESSSAVGTQEIIVVVPGGCAVAGGTGGKFSSPFPLRVRAEVQVRSPLSAFLVSRWLRAK